MGHINGSIQIETEWSEKRIYLQTIKFQVKVQLSVLVQIRQFLELTQVI